MCLIRVRAKLCRNGPDLRIPGIADILFLFTDENESIFSFLSLKTVFYLVIVCEKMSKVYEENN